MAHSLRSLGRAALWGLVMGLFGSGLVLGVLALQGTRTTCEHPDTAECTFELGNAAELARLEALAATGCVLIGAGLALGLRRRP